MSFANSWVLLFLFLIPVLVLLNLFRGRQASLGLPLSARDKSFSTFFDRIGFHLPFLLRILCLTVLIVCLARPQLGQSFSKSKNLGLDIMVAVDTSESMSALDLRYDNKEVDRLTVVKKILERFIMKRSNDRIGLIVFGENAYTQCPLTTDHGAVVDLMNRTEIGMVGKMTAIGSAMALAVKRLKDLTAKSRVLILMSDGQSNAGQISPAIATDLAKNYGVKVYTIGIGKNGEVPFKVDTPNGKQVIKSQVAMDEDTLIRIAEETGGEYFRAESTAELMDIYNYIDKLEKTEIEVKQYNSYKDIYENFLWIAFVLFLLELGLGNTLLFRIN